MTRLGFIGIDIGGTNTKIAWVDPTGQHYCLQRMYTRDTLSTAEDFVDHIVQKVRRVLQETNGTPAGIGISSPGLQMSDGSGTLFSVNLPFLNRFPLKQFFAERFNLPTFVTNDLVAHSLAEFQFGSGRGVQRFLSVSLGTGIGHTFIAEGRPVLTTHGVSGDSARMILDVSSSMRDSSGVYGSAEALCGVHGIEQLIQGGLAGSELVTAQDVITAAREQKDPAAQEILVVVSRRLAQLLVNLACVYFPEVISITGGQTEAGSFFLEECKNEFSRLSNRFFENYFSMIGQAQTIRIVKAEAGGLAGLLGSIVPLLQALTETK